MPVLQTRRLFRCSNGSFRFYLFLTNPDLTQPHWLHLTNLFSVRFFKCRDLYQFGIGNVSNASFTDKEVFQILLLQFINLYNLIYKVSPQLQIGNVTDKEVIQILQLGFINFSCIILKPFCQCNWQRLSNQQPRRIYIIPDQDCIISAISKSKEPLHQCNWQLATKKDLHYS